MRTKTAPGENPFPLPGGSGSTPTFFHGGSGSTPTLIRQKPRPSLVAEARSTICLAQCHFDAGQAISAISFGGVGTEAAAKVIEDAVAGNEGVVAGTPS